MVEGQIAIQEYETGNTKHKFNIEKLKKGHKVIKEYSYKKGEINKGFANRTLYINLSTKKSKKRK